MDFERITVDPEQMGGVPCIRSLRIPVATVVGPVAQGMAETEILAEYPDSGDRRHPRGARVRGSRGRRASPASSRRDLRFLVANAFSARIAQELRRPVTMRCMCGILGSVREPYPPGRPVRTMVGLDGGPPAKSRSASVDPDSRESPGGSVRSPRTAYRASM